MLLGALVAVLAARQKPLVHPRFTVVWNAREQLMPVAVSPRPEPELPTSPVALHEFMTERSILWNAILWNEEPAKVAAAPCTLFFRLSAQHWTRFPASRERLAALLRDGADAVPRPGDPWPRLQFPVAAFLDDEDRDGDPLDAGEILPATDYGDAGPSRGIEATILCR